MSSHADRSSITLRSSRLVVQIAPPGTIYSGTRFDWTGFITQVTLDDTHTFCVPESLILGQGTGGIGLCGEFGIDQPIGYADAAPGELFPKLGIGLLRRPDAAEYQFFRHHEIAQPFPIQIETSEPVPGESAIRFVAAPLPCRGYALRLTKTVRARQNWLEIDYRLENVGRQTIATNEYVHNFLGIDRHPMGPTYCLRFPYSIQLQDLPQMPRPANLQVSDQEIALKSTPQQPFYFRPIGFFQTTDPQWELVHLPSGATVREYDDFSPSRVAVWGTTHVISAEIFIDIRLQPDETQTWQRRYEFFQG